MRGILKEYADEQYNKNQLTLNAANEIAGIFELAACAAGERPEAITGIHARIAAGPVEGGCCSHIRLGRIFAVGKIGCEGRTSGQSQCGKAEGQCLFHCQSPVFRSKFSVFIERNSVFTSKH